MSRLVDAIRQEDLIREVEQNRTLWDVNVEEYSCKQERKKAWQSVILKFFPDFDKRPPTERSEIFAAIQKRWKSVRTGYTRELLRRKTQPKSGSGASDRKPYVYFEQLKFLENIVQHVSTNATGDLSTDDVNQDAEDARQRRKKPRTEKQKEPKEEYLSCAVNSIVPNNREPEAMGGEEDRMFLLSCVSELQRVPERNRLKVKFDILNAIMNGMQQYPYQQPNYQPNPLPYQLPLQHSFTGYTQCPEFPTQMPQSSSSSRLTNRPRRKKKKYTTCISKLEPNDTPNIPIATPKKDISSSTNSGSSDDDGAEDIGAVMMTEQKTLEQ